MVTVNASRKYDITVTDGWEKLRSVVDGVAKGDKIAIVTDTNVAGLYLNAVKTLLDGYRLTEIVVEAGEKSKSIGRFAEILETLTANEFRRDDMILALGGGVVGDLAAFSASTYMRGIRLVAVPTTLLSMIDSSVGGKTAVNLTAGKNLCGTFYQPYAVYANVETLKTLPDREVVCGKGELAKYALLDGRVTADDIDRYNTVEVIERCVIVKRDIVEADEFDKGKRMLLNLGHTIGHAYEALSGYTLPHGLCVLKGLYAAAKISQKVYNLSDEEYEKIISVPAKVIADDGDGYPVDSILSEISVDKKADKNGVSLILIKKIGECEIHFTDMETLRSYLE